MKHRLIYCLLFLIPLLIACGSKDLYQEQQEREKEEKKLSGELLTFKLEKVKNPQLTKDVDFVIYDNGNIAGYLTHEADLQSIVPTFTTTNGELQYNSATMESGKTAIDFRSTVTIELVGDNGNRKNLNVNLLPFTGLPVAVIHTEKEKAIVDKTTWVPVHIKIDGMGMFESYSDSAFVRGRGNATWLFPKKAFNMKLFNKDGLLGMPKQKRWSFLANWRDRTLLRNDVALHIGKQMSGMAWTPRSEFAEVIFNGVHVGNFQITEHVRVDKNRVNIEEMTSDDVAGEALTGGYLLELDQYWDEVNKFRSEEYNLPVNIKNPEEDVLQDVQKAYITNYINEMEKALKARDYDEVYKYLDINSFIDYWISIALTGNTELQGPYSVFCYKNRGEKLCIGPLWDFDYTAFATTEKNFNGRSTLHFSSIWYDNLWRDPSFAVRVKARFAEMKPELEKIPQYIQTRADYLRNSVEKNWKLWEIDLSELGSNQNGDETFATHQEAVDRMIAVYEARIKLVEAEIANR